MHRAKAQDRSRHGRGAPRVVCDAFHRSPVAAIASQPEEHVRYDQVSHEHVRRRFLDLLIEELAHETPAEHPRLVALGDELFSGLGEQRLAWGFEVLINGLLTTPRPTP